MNIRELNEEFRKFYETDATYELKILVNQDRGYDGDLKIVKFKAKNDLDAILKVYKQYNLQTSYIFTEDNLYPEQEQQRDEILNCLKEGRIEEGVKLITSLYFDDFDPSDLDDKIVYIKNGDRVIFEDEDLDVFYLLNTEDDEDDDDDEFNINAKQILAAEKNIKKLTQEEVKKQGEIFKKWVNEHEKETGLTWEPGTFGMKFNEWGGLDFQFKGPAYGGLHPGFTGRRGPEWCVVYCRGSKGPSIYLKSLEELQDYLLKHPYKEWLKENFDYVMEQYDGTSNEQKIKTQVEEIINS